ncbi:unnamed protein product, partial [Prorocentrum cordatum]
NNWRRRLEAAPRRLPGSSAPQRSALKASAKAGAAGSAAPRKSVQLADSGPAEAQKRTLGERIVATKQERALARWDEQQAEWERFREAASQKTQRSKNELVIAKTEEYRERLEVMELLDRSVPDEIKSGGSSWYYSLRGDGTRFVQLGDMFSGLSVSLQMHKKNYVHEIVRKPQLRDYINARNESGARSWKDDDFLQMRLRKYRAKMEELAPGKLGHDELLEPTAIGLRPQEQPQPSVVAPLATPGPVECSAPPPLDCFSPLVQVAGKQALESGPHLQLLPSRLQFRAGVGERVSRDIVLKNTGSTVINYEWGLNPPSHGFAESVLPADPTGHFTCHCVRGQVLPGREATSRFVFSADVPGAFVSSWQLSTYPELSDPFGEVSMHGVALQDDVVLEKRQNLQKKLHDDQVLHQVQELIDDILESVRRTSLRRIEPDLSSSVVQERLFEEANASQELYWTPHAWESLKGIGDRVAALKPPAEAAVAAGPLAAAREPARKLRGRRPLQKPPPDPPPPAPEDVAGVPCAKRCQRDLAALQAAPDDDKMLKEKASVSVELARATRAAQQRPLERSPIWFAAYEAVLEIATAIPFRYAAARSAAQLPPMEPFVAPPGEDAPAEVLEEYNQLMEKRQEMKAARRALGDDGKEEEMKERFVESFSAAKFGEKVAEFSAVARETTLLTKIAATAPASLRERMQPYVDRQNADGVEMGGCVVLYELDLGFLLAPAPPAEAPQEAGQPQMALTGDALELAKQRLQGVASVMESGPLALLVTAHVGEPAAAGAAGDEQVATDAGEGAGGAPPSRLLEGVAARMGSLLSLEPLLPLLKAAVGGAASSVEFVPHDDWLGDVEAFAARVRDDSAEGKVYLLDNLSAFPEELGARREAAPARADDALADASPAPAAAVGVPWAAREAWAARAFGPLQPDFLVQDSWTCACQSFTTHTGFWPAAPLRVLGPAVDAEIAAFVEALRLPFGPGGDAGAAPEGDEDAEAPRAPLLVVVGGGGGLAGARGEEALLDKLKLLVGLSRLSEHERGGLLLQLAGEAALCLLACLYGLRLGKAALPGGAAVAKMVRAALLEILKLGVKVLLPRDLVCERLVQLEPSPPPQADPKAKAKAKAKAAAAPVEADEAPPQLEERLFPLAGALVAAAARGPLHAGFLDGSECYLCLSPEDASLSLHVGPDPPSWAPAPGPAAAPAEEGPAPPAGESAGAPADGAPGGADAAPADPLAAVPGDWTVRDVGAETLEALFQRMRLCRGVLWEGALGDCSGESGRRATRAFLAEVHRRLEGGSEEADEEEEEEEEDEEEPAEPKPPKPPPKPPAAEFGTAVVIGAEATRLLNELPEVTPAVTFASGSGEGGCCGCFAASRFQG